MIEYAQEMEETSVIVLFFEISIEKFINFNFYILFFSIKLKLKHLIHFNN